MCDPVSIGLTALAGAGINSAEQSRKAASQARTAQTEATNAAAGERARAEAEAAQNANARLAETQRRRRQQNNLLATGAPAADPGTTGLLSSGETVSRSSTARQASMLGRGAPGASFYG